MVQQKSSAWQSGPVELVRKSISPVHPQTPTGFGNWKTKMSRGFAVTFIGLKVKPLSATTILISVPAKEFGVGSGEFG